eukprot:7712268-Alexandrium_andersonii.AAC.1
MSASLVGSEMCIRDRLFGMPVPAPARAPANSRTHRRTVQRAKLCSARVQEAAGLSSQEVAGSCKDARGMLAGAGDSSTSNGGP